LFPTVLASLLPRNPVTPAGAFGGILVGAVVTAVLTFTHATIGSLIPGVPAVISDLNVGIVALAANVIVLVVVSAITQRWAAPAEAV
jgi:SSS family solute:Na+ symporter